jgi:hypothetical protein
MTSRMTAGFLQARLRDSRPRVATAGHISSGERTRISPFWRRRPDSWSRGR